MMTVHEVSKLAGVSIRTLQYYDKIGLLHPTGYTEAGYRLYDDTELERLQHIQNMIDFALGVKMLGVKHMDFKAFDKSKLDEYSRQAKELYGNMPEYKEMEEKQKNRTEEDEKILADRFMLLFKEAGEMKDMDPASAEAQNLVKRIQDYITENMYTCSDKILRGLGMMYSGGGYFTKNIDAYGGEGTAVFVDQAIQIYCDKREAER